MLTSSQEFDLYLSYRCNPRDVPLSQRRYYHIVDFFAALSIWTSNRSLDIQGALDMHTLEIKMLFPSDDPVTRFETSLYREWMKGEGQA